MRVNDDPGLEFSIGGHTDNRGNREINRPLSEKRAAAVRGWLAGFGDSKPIDKNSTPEGRADNRRAEFVKS